MLKVLMQYEEATGDPRVVPFMERYAAYMEAGFAVQPLHSWGRARGGELLLWLFWLYRRRPDERYLALADRVYAMTLDWAGYFADIPFTRPTGFYFPWQEIATHFAVPAVLEWPQYHFTHVVNVAMGLKTASVYSVRSRDASHRASLRTGVEGLLRYHGVVTRLFTGDEHLSGRSPSQGTELCAVVEYMFSLESVLGLSDDTWAADTLEMLAFNALPATMTADLRGHQYVQQANQVLVSRAPRAWFNTNEESNLFGLEPNFGCCTANLHQGWPKLATALWRASAGGLAAYVYAPGMLETALPGGTRVRIETITAYPFSETITFRVHPEKKTRFPLSLRIPAWCAGASVTTPQGTDADLPAGAWTILDREWCAGDTVELTLPMRIRFSFWHRGSVGIELGPLVMASKIRELWSSDDGNASFPDWSVRPDSPWNYALALDPHAPGKGFEVDRAPVAEPFSFRQEMAPVTVRARARRVESWVLENNSAADPPESPVDGAQLDGKEETIELIPYAFARLRISQFPWYRVRA
jgi:uncharacterized protein